MLNCSFIIWRTLTLYRVILYQQKVIQGVLFFFQYLIQIVFKYNLNKIFFLLFRDKIQGSLNDIDG